MPTSPTSQSATQSGAAKDDVVGLNGNFTFTIADLLANDPGGAAKVDAAKQFKFGTTEADWTDQAKYLADHGIIDNHDGTYSITTDAFDFQYMVQIGNKGTWSAADVEIGDKPIPQLEAAVAHLGDSLFIENFDAYEGQHYDNNGVPQFAVVDLGQSGWIGAAHTELGADGYGGIQDTSPGDTGAYWLDTMNSPGLIDISNQFTDKTAAVDGKTAVLSFDIGTQSLDYMGNHYQTDPDAKLEFRIDGQVVAKFAVSDFDAPNVMKHCDIEIAGYANSGDSHMIELVGVSGSGFTGFAVDSIQIHDWVI